MNSVIVPAFRASLVFWVLCGLVYPLSVTGLAQWLLPFQANGSLLKTQRGNIIGSRLIGQRWNGPEWFHGRPSATTSMDLNDPGKIVPEPYNASNSGGSNLGPTSRRLGERLAADRDALDKLQPVLAGRSLPADMLTASGSGLDPDISPANALLQAGRVARVRGVPVKEVEELVLSHVEDRSLGIFGEPRVNVLALNLALRRAAKVGSVATSISR
jgi:potassium-transporting ATPase KdpC subunit